MKLSYFTLNKINETSLQKDTQINKLIRFYIYKISVIFNNKISLLMKNSGFVYHNLSKEEEINFNKDLTNINR